MNKRGKSAFPRPQPLILMLVNIPHKHLYPHNHLYNPQPRYVLLKKVKYTKLFLLSQRRSLNTKGFPAQKEGKEQRTGRRKRCKDGKAWRNGDERTKKKTKTRTEDEQRQFPLRLPKKKKALLLGMVWFISTHTHSDQSEKFPTYVRGPHAHTHTCVSTHIYIYTLDSFPFSPARFVCW